MSDPTLSNTTEIKHSKATLALLDTLGSIPKKISLSEGEAYEVSQTVTFLGVIYEKVRNAIEFNEEHLIRRLAISRVLRRRLSLNLKGAGEGENLVRELMWGNYVPKRSIGLAQVQKVQKIIDDYIYLYQEIQKTHTIKNAHQLLDIVINLLSCELEETLNYSDTYKTSAYLYYFYQVLRDKIALKDVSEDDRNTFFYVAAEQALLKNDNLYIRYHLFIINNGPLHELTKEQIKKTAQNFHVFYKESDRILKNPYNEKLVKFARKQSAPFRVLYHLLEKEDINVKEVLSDKVKLQREVNNVCETKYNEIAKKLNAAAFRSIIYIFFTKMILVLLVELPLSQFFFGEVHLLSLGINTLFPPVLMGLIVSFISPPSDDNTKRIYSRIVNIIDKDPSFETKPTDFSIASKSRRPTLIFVFSILYVLIFYAIFSSVYFALNSLNFNILSKIIFMFFMSVVAFFGYRIRQGPKEYILDSRNNPIVSIFTFIFLPVIYVGKVLSKEIGRINLFILLFDTLIEAPFKVFIDIFEEWSRFMKARKDELV